MHRRVEKATKPRTPTSTVRRVQSHSVWLEICSTRLLYLRSLRDLALAIPSSAGHVSSIRITFFRDGDQIMMSGRSLVAKISGGKRMLAASKSTKICQSVAPDNRLLLESGVFL